MSRKIVVILEEEPNGEGLEISWHREAALRNTNSCDFYGDLKRYMESCLRAESACQSGQLDYFAKPSGVGWREIQGAPSYVGVSAHRRPHITSVLAPKRDTLPLSYLNLITPTRLRSMLLRGLLSE